MNNKCTRRCQDCRCRNNKNANMNLTDKTDSNYKTATDNQWYSESNQNQMNDQINDKRNNKMTDERSNEQSNSQNNNRQFR